MNSKRRTGNAESDKRNEDKAAKAATGPPPNAPTGMTVQNSGPRAGSRAANVHHLAQRTQEANVDMSTHFPDDFPSADAAGVCGYDAWAWL